MGSFLTKFQGDRYYINFNLLIKIKDGRIKYEYSDFIASYNKFTSKETLLSVTTKNTSNIKTLEKLYGRAARNDDQIKFWQPIRDNIEFSIKTLQKLCLEANIDNADKW
ncbi:MAG: hypothetical protein H7329_03380 [Opitutaceae bacterium]|nr:hypothetical protein [Cytophagales bacterium]